MKTKVILAVTVAAFLGACRSDSVHMTNRFEQADANSDRLLSVVEAGNYVASNLFDSLDKDKDGRLSSKEWNAGGSMMTAQNFRKADVNSDSLVTEAELRTAAIRSKQMGDFMAGADANRDGGISKEEAMAYYASKEGPVR